MIKAILWSVWAVIPAVALSYHFGPGQAHLARDRAAAMLADARAAEAEAERLHAEAFEAHMAVFKAQRRAFLDTRLTAEDLPEAAREAVAAEQAAYAAASNAWASAAEIYREVGALLAGDAAVEVDSDAGRADAEQVLDAVSLAEARALVSAGEIFNGIRRLEDLLFKRKSVDDTMRREAELTDSVREELAAAKYIGARLLREEGYPGDVWREVATEARQHYGLLTQRKLDEEQNQPEAERLRKNVERVLDLEQSDRSELDGMPLPRRSPRGRRPGDGEPGDGDRPGRRAPPRRGPPATGASSAMPWGPGW